MSTSKDNQSAVRACFENASAGRFDALHEILSPDYVLHPDEARGVDGLTAVVQGYRDAFSGLNVTVEHQFGVDDYVANRLEFVNGVATGRLLPPVLASATKASWIRTYAEKHNINLSDSYAYSDSMSDLPMLSIVGHPAAVNPDMRLRQTALHHDWPILNLK